MDSVPHSSLEALRIASDLGRRQRGCFTTRQAAAAGISANHLTSLVRSGLITRTFAGVYTVGAPPTFEQRATAACLVTGGRASHWTAARIYGLASAPDDPIHVSRPTGPGGGKREGIVVHRPREALRMVVYDRLAVTSPVRTVVDVAAGGATDEQLSALVDVLITRKIASVAMLERELAVQASHVPGARRTRLLLASMGGAPESLLEAKLLRLLREWGLPSPVTQYEVRVAGCRRYRVDHGWPDRGVMLEVDGYRFHSSPEAFEHDRRRQNELSAAGYTVLRTTWRQIVEGSPELRRQLGALLGCAPTLLAWHRPQTTARATRTAG